MIARLSRAWAERRAPPLLRPPGGPGAVAAAAAAAAPLALALIVALALNGLAQDRRAGFALQATLAAPDAATFDAAVRVLETSPGVADVAPLDPGAPDAGGRLAAVTLQPGDALARSGAEGRLAAEAPGAVLDLHEAWRRPLLRAAAALQAAGWAGAAMVAAAALLPLVRSVRLRAGAAAPAEAPQPAQGLAQDARLLVAMGAEPSRLTAAVARIEGARALLGGVLGAAVPGAAAHAAMRFAAPAGAPPDAASQAAAPALLSPHVIAASCLAAAALAALAAAAAAWRAARAAIAPADPWAATSPPRVPPPQDPASAPPPSPSGAAP